MGFAAFWAKFPQHNPRPNPQTPQPFKRCDLPANAASVDQDAFQIHFIVRLPV